MYLVSLLSRFPVALGRTLQKQDRVESGAVIVDQQYTSQY
jgi:hypothetical protein